MTHASPHLEGLWSQPDDAGTLYFDCLVKVLPASVFHYRKCHHLLCCGSIWFGLPQNVQVMVLVFLNDSSLSQAHEAWSDCKMVFFYHLCLFVCSCCCVYTVDTPFSCKGFLSQLFHRYQYEFMGSFFSPLIT